MAMKRVRKLEQMGLQSAPRDSKTVALQMDRAEFDVVVSALQVAAKVWRQAAKTSTQEAAPEEERKATRQIVKEAKFLERMATRLVHAATEQP